MIWDNDISFEGLYKDCNKLNDRWAEQYNELNKKLVDICQKIREENKDD